jgi:16S rRNA (cytosine967-C5)-methyltransferase
VSVSPARRAAYETLLRVFEDGAYADRAFRTAAAQLESRDRALAQRLAYGTIQRVRTLDHGLESIGRRPVAKLDPPVRAALRLGAYQLAFSEVATHAAVNESVELVRAARLERAVKFANAVLRRLALGFRDLAEALPESTPQEAGLKHSYPDWVAETWWRDLGAEEAVALMRAQNEPAEVVVRRSRLKEGAVEGEPDPDLPDALHVERVDEQALEAGLIWPQSRGSQLAGLAVGAQPGERILDLCAAPGGKATQLAEVSREVVAVEKHEGRARELEENLQWLGATNVRVVNADALELPDDLGEFDRVLVDAPCSGLGVLAARPDLRWRSQPLPDLQRDLLRMAADRVKAGGTIVYSVCTINGRHPPGSRAPRRRVAAVRPPEAAGVPPGDSSPPPHVRLLHREPKIAAMSWQDWIRTVEVEPSLYAADFSRLGEQVETLLRAECRVFHWDVGDGHFVPPVTMGPIVLKWIDALVHREGGVLDVHLMVESPERHFAEFREAGADSVTVHYETCPSLPGVVAVAREHDLQVGLAFNPETSVEQAAAAALEAGVDLLLCMSVHPGYSGQDFIPESLERVRVLRELMPETVPVQVDGGVGPSNIRDLREAGATLFVAATAIFGREDLPRAYRRLVTDLA